MHAEWTAECAAEDPVLVVPWAAPHDADSDAAFVDLRANPGAIDTIPEAEAHPPLMQSLRALNAARSPVFTAKCDAWEMGADEIAQLKLELGIGPGFLTYEEDMAGDAAKDEDDDTLVFGFASYIDCVFCDRALFASFPRHEHLLRTVARLGTQLDHPQAALECVLRPAFVHLDTARQGYAVSVYVKALNESPQRAWRRWAAALADVTAILRSRESFR